MIETFSQPNISKRLILYSLFVVQILLIQCSSAKYKELEPDDLLEQELRAEPEKFRDSESREFRERDDPKKGMKKK